ncbi:MAG: ABC transporter permease [Oscillospiraceae bacterium]|nr:ABC transporter permease [Oscillospiraceae bacterium]MCI9363673.1 ABC transporter permease [Oscillospiraceae bacterium]MCI9669094.1 ABC transporter permease [Oscillospiraceae bacterium]RKJ56287.1 ABC transporter permease [bacterium 1XD42-8]RKJ64706.1 ABC transporter permease [bacterium 1XD42-1]
MNQLLKKKSVGRFLMDWAAVIALVFSIIVFTIMQGQAFFSAANATNILRAMSITTIFAIAATVTMAPDGFDMSACTLASFSAYIFASSFLWFGMPLLVSAIVTILFTMVLYLLTMFLILVCKIPDMLATCSLMFVHQGLGLWWTGGGAVSSGMPTRWGGQPVRAGWTEGFLNIGRAPWCIIIMLACVAFAFIFLNYTKHGRYLYAMGGNRVAAKLSGINVKRYRFVAGMVTAVFIAIGAMVVCSRNSAAQITGCDNYLMPSLAAVFVGRSVGGAEKPNAIGTMIGAALVAVLENGLTQVGVVYYVLPAVKGAVLALALVVAYASKKED